MIRHSAIAPDPHIHSHLSRCMLAVYAGDDVTLLGWGVQPSVHLWPHRSLRPTPTGQKVPARSESSGFRSPSGIFKTLGEKKKEQNPLHFYKARFLKISPAAFIQVSSGWQLAATVTIITIALGTLGVCMKCNHLIYRLWPCFHIESGKLGIYPPHKNSQMLLTSKSASAVLNVWFSFVVICWSAARPMKPSERHLCGVCLGVNLTALKGDCPLSVHLQSREF